jgi:hypothetical protein
MLDFTINCVSLDGTQNIHFIFCLAAVVYEDLFLNLSTV